MGFAVVADEVRSRAQRSAQSAKETASKIEVAIKNGENGVVISEKVARSLGIIVEQARPVDELVAEIATASQEQSQGMGQINSAISQLDKVTQSNASTAEETAAAKLNAQSTSLRASVQDLRHLVDGARAHSAAFAPPPSQAPNLPRVSARAPDPHHPKCSTRGSHFSGPAPPADPPARRSNARTRASNSRGS